GAIRRATRLLSTLATASTPRQPASGRSGFTLVPPTSCALPLLIPMVAGPTRCRAGDTPGSHEPPGAGPAGQLVAVGELELAQHAGDVRLDGLHRDEELLGDLLVRVAAG